MSSIRVQPALPEHISDVLGLMRELAEFEKLLDSFHADEERLLRFAFGPEKVVDLLVASLDDEIVGYSVFFSSFSTFLCLPGVFVEDLYVRPALRGRGVAQALLGEIATIAEARGCARLEGIALDWNERARRYYEALGAEALEEWVLYRIPEKGIQRLARRAKRTDNSK